MIKCTTCGHQNLPNYTTCSKCGSPLGAGASGGGGAADEYQQLMARRAAAARRNKMIYAGVGAAALIVVGYLFYQDSAKKSAAQEKLNFADRWADLEKRETGLFWACVMASEVDVGMFTGAQQFQQRVEAAYATQPKTFADHIVTECVPKMERARQAMAALADAPAELKAALESYRTSLPKLQTGIETYAERIRNRGTTKDLDQLIQEYGNAWHSEQKPTPETIAFEKFMHCAVPGLDKMKDVQGMLEFLADACFKKDAVAFMDRVRKDCGPLLQNVDPKAAPAKSYKATNKKFYEEDARQLSAWSDCGRKARKGKKVEDLEEFLMAVGDYMKARSDVAAAARGIAESVK